MRVYPDLVRVSSKHILINLNTFLGVFFLSFCLNLDLFLPTYCRRRGLLLHLITISDTHTHTR